MVKININFPIFNNDYDFHLEEIVRYLKKFNHNVRIKRSYSYFVDNIFVSEHRFRDGLYIRLFWFTKFHDIHEIQEDIWSLFKFHKKGHITLKNFDFMAYSHNELDIGPPNKNSANIFFNHVLKNKKLKRINEARYSNLEFTTSSPTQIPDFLFQIIVEHTNNEIEFEKYYKNHIKNNGKITNK